MICGGLFPEGSILFVWDTGTLVRLRRNYNDISKIHLSQRVPNCPMPGQTRSYAKLEANVKKARQYGAESGALVIRDNYLSPA